MRCATCGSDNTEGSRFCGVCGEPLPRSTSAREVMAPAPSASPPRVTAPLPARPTSQVVAPSPFDPSETSMKVPAARGGGGRAIAIVLLLLLDAGLVTAGTLFLKTGLAAGEGGDAGEGSASASGSEGSGGRDASAGSGASGASAIGSSEVTPDSAVASANTGGGASDHGGDHGGGSTGSHGSAGTTGTTGTGTGAGTSMGTGMGTSAGTGTGTGSQTPDDVIGGIFGKRDAGAGSAVVRTPDASPASQPPPPSPPDAGSGSTLDPYATPDAPPPPSPPDAAPSGSGSDDDPHTVDLAAEVERKSSQSQSRFTHCYEDAAKAYTPDQPLVGEVDIAFRVMPTGEVQNAAAVKNTTGSDKLSDCLVAVIGGWSFPPSQLGEPAVFVRPFRFDGH